MKYTSTRTLNPLDILLPYQRRIVEDDGRFIAACFARQTGKSFTVAAKVARALILVPRLTVLIAAPSERQSRESLDKVKDWLRSFAVAYADEITELKHTEYNAATIRLANGSRCVAVPGKPETVRGFSACVWLDEFAFFEDPDGTWRAILPSITNPLRGGEKWAILTSTPNGQGGRGKRFYDIMHDGSGKWHTHTVTLRDAIAGGLHADYDELADAINDPLAIAQELNCEYLDGSNVLLPYELIASASSSEASLIASADLYTRSGRALYLGFDFGRFRDPSVLVCLELVGDVLFMRECLVLQDMPTEQQVHLLRPRLRAAMRLCLDYTGPGIGTGDLLAADFGTYSPARHCFGKVELCTFTSLFKRELFPKLRRRFETPVRLRIAHDRALQEDLHAMQQTVSNGNYSYDAPRTKDGHSDRCTALALAVRAAEHGGHIAMPCRLPGGRTHYLTRRLGGIRTSRQA